MSDEVCSLFNVHTLWKYSTYMHTYCILAFNPSQEFKLIIARKKT